MPRAKIASRFLPSYLDLDKFLLDELGIFPTWVLINCMQMQLNLGLKFFPLPTLSYAHYYLIVMILMGIAAKRGLKCWSHEVNYFTLERICSRYYSILVFCFCGIQTKIASQPQRDFPNSTFMTSVTRSWPKRSEISTKKNSQSSLYLKKVTLSK